MKSPKTPWILSNEISPTAREMLNIIKEKPKISTKEIKDGLAIRSGHTFVKYMNQLIFNNLVNVSREANDKRKKHFTLTDKGNETQKFVKGKMRIGCEVFFQHCEDLYFLKHPEYIKDKRKIGYVSDSLFESLKNIIFEYIDKIVKI